MLRNTVELTLGLILQTKIKPNPVGLYKITSEADECHVRVNDPTHGVEVRAETKAPTLTVITTGPIPEVILLSDFDPPRIQ